MFTTDDCIVLPGGFSYSDYLRCGAIARFSPMMKSVIAFAEKGRKGAWRLQRHRSYGKPFIAGRAVTERASTVCFATTASSLTHRR